MAALRKTTRFLFIATLSVGAFACGQTQAMGSNDLQRLAKAPKGAFEAADEVCVGSGGMSESLKRSEVTGWREFEPQKGSMFDGIRSMYLEDDDLLTPLKISFLWNDDNRAQVVLTEKWTLFRDRFIHSCEVIEPTARELDVADLKRWARVKLEERQIDDSPIYHDFVGGRFANNVSAMAFFVPESEKGESPSYGLQLAFTRSNLEPTE